MAAIYLTFDDGPDPDFTPRVLDVLGEAQVHATFFVIGTQARRWPEVIRRAASEGHDIANHSYSHRHPWWMSERAARAEVRGGAEAVSDVLGTAPTFFRPPHGRERACMRDVCTTIHIIGAAIVSLQTPMFTALYSCRRHAALKTCIRMMQEKIGELRVG